MRIKSIEIKNFRSIKDAQIEASDFNILVGQNNCGKTNFFEAVDFFYNGVPKKIDINSLKFKHDTSFEIEVSIKFSDCQEGASKMKNEKNKASILKAIGDSDEITITRSSLNLKKRTVFVNGVEVSHGTGFDTALNDFLPKFEYVNTKQYYDSVAKYASTTPMGIMLSGVLSEIVASNQKYKEFQEKFNEHLLLLNLIKLDKR